MDFGKVIKWLSWDEIPPEFISSILALLIMLILTIVIRIKLRNYDALEKPKGFFNAFEAINDWVEKQVIDLMGPAFKDFAGYILFTGGYILLGFIIGWIGIPNIFQPSGDTFGEPLPNPFTNIAMPLSIALITFVLTHYTAIKYKHWSYFERYLEPIPIFLPVNLVTMWSSLLSLTLRLFGNALAGYCVITLIYVGLGTSLPPEGSLVGMVFDPILAPIGHLYFDLFDGLIQMAVFTILTMINISNEYISPEEYKLSLINKKQEKEMKKQRKLEKKAKRVGI